MCISFCFGPVSSLSLPEETNKLHLSSVISFCACVLQQTKGTSSRKEAKRKQKRSRIPACLDEKERERAKVSGTFGRHPRASVSKSLRQPRPMSEWRTRVLVRPTAARARVSGNTTRETPYRPFLSTLTQAPLRKKDCIYSLIHPLVLLRSRRLNRSKS